MRRVPFSMLRTAGPLSTSASCVMQLMAFETVAGFKAIFKACLCTLHKMHRESHESNGALLKPQVIDLGKHIVPALPHELLDQRRGHKGNLKTLQTRRARGRIVSLLQVTLASMYHRAAFVGLKPIPSKCCLRAPFWHAPSARHALFGRGFPGNSQTVMVFTCFCDYQSIYQRGKQAVAEDALELYKTCVLLAVDLCGGYECQEVNAVFMLAFPTPLDAIRYHLVLQVLRYRLAC